MRKIMFNDEYCLNAAALIDQISGKDTWKSNPWAFVYDFDLIK